MTRTPAAITALSIARSRLTCTKPRNLGRLQLLHLDDQRASPDARDVIGDACARRSIGAVREADGFAGGVLDVQFVTVGDERSDRVRREAHAPFAVLRLARDPDFHR